jgi:multidrug efflux pump subunit AcrA (membrane-fusion protein)
MLVLVNVAKPGSRVKKGDVVAEFDRQYMLLRLEDYKASGVQMDANIKKLKADLAVAKESEAQTVRAAKADLDSAMLDLKTISVRSEIESERFKLAAEQAQARYKQALADTKLYEESWRAQLKAVEIDREQARIEFKRATANVDRMVIKAPIDGIVVMQTMHRSGGENAQIQQGDQVYPGMFFMSIVDPSSMIMNASVNQADSEALRLNMKARIRLDAYTDVDLPGTVVGIGAMTRPGGWRASYVREIPVRLKLNAMDPRIIPDLSASADVVLGAERQAIIAPRAAVFTDSGAEHPFVWLHGPAGWIRREIELGLGNNIAVAVHSGLRKGDVVAVQKPLS